MVEMLMEIKEMKCSGCETTIRKHLLKLAGIYDARADFKTGKLLLSVTSGFQPSEVVKALPHLGYTVVEYSDGTFCTENVSTE